jgi:hypothetical protein
VKCPNGHIIARAIAATTELESGDARRIDQ